MLAACEPDDNGKTCPPPEGTVIEAPDSGGGDTEKVSPATVRTDGQCESFQCVSTQVRSNYCSRECANDGDCADGFVCALLQPVGPLATTTYCLLAKTCRPGVVADCPRDTMECRRVETTVPDQPAFFCDVKE